MMMLSAKPSTRLHPFHGLPAELRASILRFSNNLELSIKLESIGLNLPSLYPDDPTSAFDHLTHDHFPASRELARRIFDPKPNFASSDLNATVPYPPYMASIDADDDGHSLFNDTETSDESEEEESDISNGSYIESLESDGVSDEVTIEARHIKSILFMSNVGVAWIYWFRPSLWTESATIRTVQQGRLPLLQMLHRKDSPTFTPCLMDIAAGRGFFDIVRYLHEHRQEGCTTEAINLAATEGHLDIVKYLYENRVEGCTAEAMKGAAENGWLEVVKYLYKVGTLYDESAIVAAASRGMLNIVKFLCESGKGYSNRAVDWAAMEGQIEVVKYFYGKGLRCSKEAKKVVGQKKLRAVLAFLRKNR
ncbi:hypothetical protein BC829DRAFT_407405 [Chytridium lagenaria]|nr:hypothetical protein BC829DRAFT_407405 [Chytridium lagenaria]